MRRTPARREVEFVLAVAGAGLAAVLAVAFAPWYQADPPSATEVSGDRSQVVHLIEGGNGRVDIAP